MNAKERAAEAALRYVENGMVVGLGTGSTADCFLRALAGALRSGKVRNIRGIATSRQSERRAEELGIPLVQLSECPRADITVDGADEVDPKLDLIKGLGGALLREKIVAQNTGRFIIIADSSKRVEQLGTRSPLPVEVVQFGHESHVAYLAKLGCRPVLRKAADGGVFVTDNGNYIYDCRFDRIEDARAIENAILHRAGMVDCGLFLGMAKVALIADERGVKEMRRA